MKLHKFTEEIDTKAICNFGDMRNSNTVSNICVGRRHELENSDNFRLNDRKIKVNFQEEKIQQIVHVNFLSICPFTFTFLYLA